MGTVSYPLRIPENLLPLVELRTKEMYVDKSTAMRQLLYMGATDYLLDLYSRGQISLSRAAAMLNKSVYDVIRMARERGIEIGATSEQQEMSEETAELLESE